ncbi:hypothetical protein HDV05_002425 [Chytridiales sp. JEL 0842]|nr:hypothetical protein HDV05_002425 [Chytridiales sp. JEL 0842]
MMMLKYSVKLAVAFTTTTLLTLPSLSSTQPPPSPPPSTAIPPVPPTPAGFGPLCSDRAAWQPLLTSNPQLVSSTLSKADAHLSVGYMPPFNESAYMLYYQTGNRDVGQQMLKARHNYVADLFLAECFTMQGKYLQTLEEALQSYASQPSWVLPAHDPDLKVYRGERKYVDLNGALVASLLGHVLYSMGDTLSANIKQNVRQELLNRALNPYMDRLFGRTNTDNWWWLRADNNWNSVCHSGLLYAVVAVVPDASIRAQAVVKVQEFSKNFLKSYLNDGYGTEGVSYFSYGFDSYSELRETIYTTTQGILDLFADPKVARIARLPDLFPMTGGAVAPFGDAMIPLKASHHAHGPSKAPSST